MNPLIAPSILAADFARLGDEVQGVLDAGADVIHFDVMDNHYVPNLSFGPVVFHSLKRQFKDTPFDVHLMVEPVESMIDAFLKAGASYISIHPESTRQLRSALERIRKGGAKAGVVLNPDTEPSVLQPVVGLFDLVLIMSVYPGFGGQEFMDSSLEKVAAVRRFIDSDCKGTRLEIDGGISIDNIGRAQAAGADMFVAGSSIFGSSDYSQTIQRMRAQIGSNPGV